MCYWCCCSDNTFERDRDNVSSILTVCDTDASAESGDTVSDSTTLLPSVLKSVADYETESNLLNETAKERILHQTKISNLQRALLEGRSRIEALNNQINNMKLSDDKAARADLFNRHARILNSLKNDDDVAMLRRRYTLELEAIENSDKSRPETEFEQDERDKSDLKSLNTWSRACESLS